MPELPEVENVRQKLESWAAGRLILATASSGSHRGVKAGLDDLIVGRRARSVERRGKFLLLRLDPVLLAVHLGMSGRFIRRQGVACLSHRHDHFAFGLDDGWALYFNDFRKFGRVFTCSHDLSNLPRLGAEPLSKDFSPAQLASALSGRRAPLKAVLMDQAVIAGLGNIYACECLWAARLVPWRPAATLGQQELEILAGAIQNVLSRAIEAGGATLDDYRGTSGEMGSFDRYFAVFGRVGQPCPSCGSPVEVGRIAGRITYWCPKCQR